MRKTARQNQRLLTVKKTLQKVVNTFSHISYASSLLKSMLDRFRTNDEKFNPVELF